MPTDPLLDPTALVPVPEGDSPLAVAQRAMARWSNGEDHLRRRSLAVEAISALDVQALRDAAFHLAVEALAAERDLVLVARRVPVVVLAEALGFPSPEQAAVDQRIVTAAIAPEDAAPPVDRDEVSSALERLLVAADQPSLESSAARVALLHQCADATAGLICGSVVSTGDGEAPVVSTVRVVDGERTIVPLAGRPFGAGAHACPGAEVALALAAGVEDAVRSSGLRPAEDDLEWERRVHLRIPRSLPLVTDGPSTVAT